MPYKSEKQRAFMHTNEPEIAAKWDKKYGGKVAKGKDKKRNRPVEGLKKAYK